MAVSSPAKVARKRAPPVKVKAVFGREKAADDYQPLPRVPRTRYRRSPFYLKIEGLTGPRPVYDIFGKLVAAED